MYKSWKNRNLTSATPFFAAKTEMARGTRTNTGPNDAEDETRIPSENPQLDALLQGLERVTRVAMDYEQRHPREADTFFEYYRSFTSLRPPTFDGTGDFAAAENWVTNVKDKLQILRAPEEHRVELATQLLEGHARFWWQEVKREWGETPKAKEWTEFEGQFERRYMDTMSREALRQRFTSLKQGNNSVAEYNSKFENLMRYAPDIVRDDFRLRQQYLGGLNPRLAQIIDISGTNRLSDLMLRANTADRKSTRLNSSHAQ